MIVNLTNQHVNKIVTPLGIPAVSDNLLAKHVERGAVLYLIMDEELWITQDIAKRLYESLAYMQSLGAKQNQMMLVLVLMESDRGREYDQLRYWQRSGGIGICIEQNNLDLFFKNENKYVEGKL